MPVEYGPEAVHMECFQLFGVAPVRCPGLTAIEEILEDHSSVHQLFGRRTCAVVIQHPGA